MIDKENTVFRVVKMKPGVPVRAYKKFGGEIGAEIDKHDLIKAIVEMVGNPTMLFTKQQLYDKIDYAMERIQANMQESTISVAGLKVPHE